MTEESEEILLLGDIEQVAGSKEEHRRSHVEQCRLVGTVIAWRRVVHHHKRHRDELDVVEPGLSLHFLSIKTTNYTN